MKTKKADRPQWANAEKTAINLTVEFEGLGEVPFTAIAEDPEEHGRELFAKAAAGEFGRVRPYVAPKDPEPERKERKRARAVAALADVLGIAPADVEALLPPATAQA